MLSAVPCGQVQGWPPKLVLFPSTVTCTVSDGPNMLPLQTERGRGGLSIARGWRPMTRQTRAASGNVPEVG
jgi:hypothetical protein